MQTILWEISWPNLLMLSAAIPSYEKDGDEKDGPAEPIDPKDLTNFFGF